MPAFPLTSELHFTAIMAQTGHRSVQVLRGYIRSGGLFTENAAAQVGL
jgi:hypothetical protein